MDSLTIVTTFLGWCTIINIVIILMFLIIWSNAQDSFGDITARMFGVSQDEVKATVFRVFMQYRIAFAVLNLVPYLALKIMQ